MKIVRAGVLLPIDDDDGPTSLRNTPRFFEGEAVAVEDVHLPIGSKTTVNENLSQIIGRFSSRFSRTKFLEHAAQSHLPLVPNAYQSDDDVSAGEKIDRARNHLSCMDDEDDEISADERLDRAINLLTEARAQRRAAGPGAIGQHGIRFVK